MIPLPIYLFILIELIFVSYGDIKTSKIPNMWSIMNIFVYPILLFIVPSAYFFEIGTFIYSFAFLFIGFILFLLKIMGAGDVKYLFSFFLLIPKSLQSETFSALLYSTVLIGLFVFITNFIKYSETIINSLKIKDFRTVKECFGTKFSYAPVILIAWLWIGWNLKEKLFNL